MTDIELVEELQKRGLFHEIQEGTGLQLFDNDVSVINRSKCKLLVFIYLERANEGPDFDIVSP